jgi:hypothetical protein
VFFFKRQRRKEEKSSQKKSEQISSICEQHFFEQKRHKGRYKIHKENLWKSEKSVRRKLKVHIEICEQKH